MLNTPPCWLAWWSSTFWLLADSLFWFFFFVTLCIIKMDDSGDETAWGPATNTPFCHVTNHNVTNITYATPFTAVSIKVPHFLSEQPGVWFSQPESQFTIKGITATVPPTNFAYKVSNLTQDIRTPDHIPDPLVDPYNSIKTWLISIFVLSNYQKAETLINLPVMGDQKPTVLMDKMLHLMPYGHDPCFLFLQHLPPDLQVLLMNDVMDQLWDLAAKADIL